MSSPVSGNHHDLYQIDYHLDELYQTLAKVNIATDGLFVNADAGFDSKKFRSKCFEYVIIPNTAINPRNGTNDEVIIFYKCFMNRDIPLKEPMLGWIHTGHCLIALEQRF